MSAPAKPKPDQAQQLAALEALLRSQVGRVARELTARLQGKAGYCLLVFDRERRHRLIACADNTDRATTLEVLREYLDRTELPEPCAARVRSLAGRLRQELRGAKLDKLISAARYRELVELLGALEGEMDAAGVAGDPGISRT